MLARSIATLLLIACSMTSFAVGDEPLDALIITGQMNKWHDAVGTTPILKNLLEETGLFKVEVTVSPAAGEEMSGFRPNFSAYDVLVMNYDGDPWPDATKQDLVDYMRAGGGMVVYHSADNAFPDWKAYNQMIALGGWAGRNEKDGPYVRLRDSRFVHDMTPGVGGSHGPQHEFPLVVREADHPVMKGLPKKFMHSTDELYDRLRGPAENLTVLATAYSSKDKKGTGEHEPMLMDIRFGKGRIFHTTLGHGPEHLESVAFIATYQRGAEWAATGKVTQEVPDDFPGPDQPVMRE